MKSSPVLWNLEAAEKYAQCMYITYIMMQGHEMSESDTTIGRDHYDPAYSWKGGHERLKNGYGSER